MKLIIYGVPAIGKSLVAKDICKGFGLIHINLGDLLRQNEDIKVEKTILEGKLVEDVLINELVRKELEKQQNNFLLDGYPRTIPQAEYLDSVTEIDFFLYLKTSRTYKELLELISGRRICDCGEIYNTYVKPPQQEGICDCCGNGLKKRDDQEEIIAKKRLNLYFELTPGLLNFYQEKIIEVGADDFEEMRKKVKEGILEMVVDKKNNKRKH